MKTQANNEEELKLDPCTNPMPGQDITIVRKDLVMKREIIRFEDEYGCW